MSRFFDDPDYDVIREHEDKKPGPPKLPKQRNSGTSNEAYLNDYRNRMPFHYIEEGSDGYYYWQYGATMEIEFVITDEVAQTQEAPPYLVDVRLNGKSVVADDSGIADLSLGSMSEQETDNYYTAEQVNNFMAQAVKIASDAKELVQRMGKQVEQITRDLYSIAGPEYLMSRLVEGSNISLQRDLSDPAEPKLRIASIGGGQTALFVTAGMGTFEEPFLVTTPEQVLPKIFEGESLSTIVFANLPQRGLKYKAGQEFYIDVVTDKDLGEHYVHTFTIVGSGMSSVRGGKLTNNLYSLVGDKLVDVFNANQVQYVTPTDEMHYDVSEGVPFMFIRTVQTELLINESLITSVVCSDVAGDGTVSLSVRDLPSGVPFIGIFTVDDDPILTVSFAHLSPTYLEDVIAPLVDAKKIDAESIQFEEAKWED